MKRIIIIVLSLIIIVALGYGMYYLISAGSDSAPIPSAGFKTVPIDDGMVTGWREENRTGNSSETGL
jgi:hypothetical protein